MSQFIVGQRYVTRVKNVYPECGLSAIGTEFTCGSVDNGGDCWAECEFGGQLGVWCVATLGELLDGDVALVGDQSIDAQDAANLVTLDKRDLFDFVRTAIKYAMLEQGSREDDAELYADATDRTEKCLSDLYGSQS